MLPRKRLGWLMLVFTLAIAAATCAMLLLMTGSALFTWLALIAALAAAGAAIAAWRAPRAGTPGDREERGEPTGTATGVRDRPNTP